jgi:hypothetical protein
MERRILTGGFSATIAYIRKVFNVDRFNVIG